MAHRTDNEPSPARQQVALQAFELGLDRLATREKNRIGKKNMWLAHHWPDDYPQRCVKIGSRQVCRRCAALYPFSLLIASAASAGYPAWPAQYDPWPIWILSLPATIAYCGEALGFFGYSARWQVATMLITAVAFGRALAYEWTSPLNKYFWLPAAAFGLIWFSATAIGKLRRKDLI